MGNDQRWAKCNQEQSFNTFKWLNGWETNAIKAWKVQHQEKSWSAKKYEIWNHILQPKWYLTQNIIKIGCQIYNKHSWKILYQIKASQHWKSNCSCSMSKTIDLINLISNSCWIWPCFWFWMGIESTKWFLFWRRLLQSKPL